MKMPASQILVRMKNIVKKFPGVLALDNVDFELLSGEVHMLLGENGAGKSTLIKVLSGAYLADSGEIFIKEEKINMDSPHVALANGLRFIYQEVNLVPTLDIARNMFLGMEPFQFHILGIVNKKELYASAGKYLEKLNIDLDPHEIVGRLSVTKQKMIEIARALVTKADVIVLDEPTDVLEENSRNDLFTLINQLKLNHSVGFIYISHRYAEVHELGDRVTILRDGRNMGTYTISDLTLNQMIEKMIGGKLEKQYPSLSTPTDEIILKAEHISRATILNDISIEVRKGEILGITGLMGSGKTELARAIAGIDKIDKGDIFINNKKIDKNSIIKSIKNGIAYMTEDRKTQGLILDHSIRNNYALPSLGRLSKAGLVKHKTIDEESTMFMEKLKIKALSMRTPCRQLSGGNQQKAVLAKWLGAHCKVLLIDEPTRGVDIKGRADVYKILEDLIEDGVGIIMFSSDYLEVLEMSHRILVLRHGSVIKEFMRGETTEQEILRVAIGAEE